MDPFYAQYLTTLFEAQRSQNKPNFQLQSTYSNLMVHDSSKELIMGLIELYEQKDSHQLDLLTYIINKADYTVMLIRNKLQIKDKQAPIKDHEIEKLGVYLQKNPDKPTLYLLKLVYHMSNAKSVLGSTYSYVSFLQFYDNSMEWISRQGETIKLKNILQAQIQKGELKWIDPSIFVFSNSNKKTLKGHELINIKQQSFKIKFKLNLSTYIKEEANFCDYSCLKIWEDVTIICYLDRQGLVYCLLPLCKEKPTNKQEILLKKFEGKLMRNHVYLLSTLNFMVKNPQIQYYKIKIYQHQYKQTQFWLFALHKIKKRSQSGQKIIQFYLLMHETLDFKFIQVIRLELQDQNDKQDFQCLFTKLIKNKVYVRSNSLIKSIDLEPTFQYFHQQDWNQQAPLSLQIKVEYQLREKQVYKDIVECNDKVYMVTESQSTGQMSIVILSSEPNANYLDYFDEKMMFIRKALVQNQFEGIEQQIMKYPTISPFEILLKHNQIRKIPSFLISKSLQVYDQIGKEYESIRKLAKKLNKNGYRQFDQAFGPKIQEYQRLLRQVTKNDAEIQRQLLQIDQIKEGNEYKEHMSEYLSNQQDKLELTQSFHNPLSSPNKQTFLNNVNKLLNQLKHLKQKIQQQSERKRQQISRKEEQNAEKSNSICQDN